MQERLTGNAMDYDYRDGDMSLRGGTGIGDLATVARSSVTVFEPSAALEAQAKADALIDYAAYTAHEHEFPAFRDIMP